MTSKPVFVVRNGVIVDIVHKDIIDMDPVEVGRSEYIRGYINGLLVGREQHEQES